MPRGNRMPRRWANFTSGAEPLALAANASARVLLLSVLEADLGRTVETFTVTRVIFGMNLLSLTSGPSVVACGLIVHPESFALGQIDPNADIHTDWFWWGEFLTNSGGGANQPPGQIVRDIAGQRRATGQAPGVFFYIENRDANESISFHIAGRVLLLGA